MRLTHSGFFLMLVLSTANTFAGPDGRGRGFLQHAVLERNVPGGEQQSQRQGDFHHGKFLELPPDSSGYNSQGDSGSGSQDNSRRQGKLSPEERRTLRRQIDEVGHDIYSPKR